MRPYSAWTALISISAVFLTFALASGGRGQAAGASGMAKLRGQIIASDQPAPTLDDEDKIVETVKKWQKGTIEKPKDGDGWTLHLLSFPDKKPGVTQLSLLFYDVSEGKPKYLTSKDVSCDPTAEILSSEVDIDTDDGFKPGMKIDVTLAKVVGGKQIDLAKTKLQLK